MFALHRARWIGYRILGVRGTKSRLTQTERVDHDQSDRIPANSPSDLKELTAEQLQSSWRENSIVERVCREQDLRIVVGLPVDGDHDDDSRSRRDKARQPLPEVLPLDTVDGLAYHIQNEV